MDLNDGRAGAQILRERFEAQRAARDAMPAPDWRARRETLATLESMLLEGAGELCAAIDADFRGRSEHETRLLEILPAVEAIRHARRHVRAWMRPQRRATGRWFLAGRSRVMFQPLGVTGIVVPWNYPVYLAIGPMVSALAAGNRVLAKMSEAAPATGAALAGLVERRFDAAQVAIVNGGVEVAREFVALPFDHLLFTGSTEVGREVMRAAAAGLTPVTLELGGKSPAIVGRKIDIAQAAERIVYGKCLNAGQTCIAPDYALVPQESVAAFAAAAREAVVRLYPRLAANPDYTAIVNDCHRARLCAWLDEARAAGARVEEINPAHEDLALSPKLAPHLVIGAPETIHLMREEIFGPILPIVPYRAIDDAIAYVNRRARPLALYVFDHDRAAVARILERTVSGGVTVNETLLHIAQDDLPFGGVGASGMGEYHGRAGFETFSKRKAVFHQPRVSALGLLRPPYGKRFDALLAFMLRRR